MIDLDCKGEVPLAPSWVTFIDLDISIRVSSSHFVTSGYICIYIHIRVATTTDVAIHIASISIFRPVLVFNYSAGWLGAQPGVLTGYLRGTGTEWVLRGVLNGY
jgi:hypothetical protein